MHTFTYRLKLYCNAPLFLRPVDYHTVTRLVKPQKLDHGHAGTMDATKYACRYLRTFY